MSVDPESIEKAVNKAIAEANFIAVRDRLTVGDSVGLYRVTDSSPQRLRMAIGSGGALAMVMVSVLVLLLDVWLFKTGTIRWMRMAPDWFKGAIVGLPFIGLFMIAMFGRSFEFVAAPAEGMRTCFIQKRWLWVFGQPIDASRVAAVEVRLRSRDANSYDRILVSLVDSAGNEVLSVADEASDEKDVGAAFTLAVQLREVLAKPVRVQGEPVVMNDYAKDALGRLREKVGAAS